MKFFKKIFILLVLTLSFVPGVKAEEAILSNNDNIEVSYDVTSTGDYDKSTFFLGNSIYDNTNVDGISFILGNSVNLNGNYEYGMILGNIVSLNGTYQKDLLLIGNVVSSDLNVLRDAYIISSTIDLTGIVGRNINIIADYVYLDNITVNGDISIDASSINFGDNVVINGTLEYNENALIDGIESANVFNIIKYEEEIDTNVDGFSFTDFMISSLGFILLGIVVYALCPKAYKKTKEQINNYNITLALKDMACGILTLIGFPIFMIMLLITIIGIPISIIGLIIYGILIYFTTIIIGYLLGDVLISKITKKDANGYLAIIVGVLVIKIIKLIPFVGGLVSFIVLVLGLGLLVKMLFPKKEKIKVEN